jgi:hypothetical protein
MPPWVDIVVKLTPAFVTLVVGIVAAGIGYLQYRLGHDKLRLDLFSKRLEAYEKLQEFFLSVFRTGSVDDATLAALAEARYKSRFLFGPEVEASFDVLWKKAVAIRGLRPKLYGPGSLPVGPERSAVCEQDSELVKWMMNQMEEAPDRYSKYLRFK